MNVQLTHILQTMFQADTLEDVPPQKLEQLADQYPYFAPAQFLLAKKMQRAGGNAYEAQAQKASLYFHDPLWLQWQLKEQEPVKAVEEVQGVQEEVETVEEVQRVQIVQQEVEEVRGDIEGIETVEKIVVEEQGLEVGMDEATQAGQPVETGKATEAVEAVSMQEAVVAAGFMQPDAEPPAQEAPAAENPATPGPAPVPPAEPSPDGAKDIAFDPYYTIDYFASQGIKAPAELQPGDKLGRQLKSFTEWLKTMKRLPQPAAYDQPTEAEQQHIQEVAAGSLEQKEVVTETMAEVLVKQDKKEEAIAIYEKLSLLDPSKKAFFAAKIENLKES